MIKIRIKRLFLNPAIYLLVLHQLVFADAVFDPATQPIVSIAPYTLKSTNLEEGETRAYRPWFAINSWQGDVIEYKVSKSGLLSTDVTKLVDNPPLAAGNNWSARASIAAKELADANYWTAQRKIITSINGTDQKPFRWNELSKDQQKALDNTHEGKKTSPVLNYIRGNRADELTDLVRVREGILGDITSSPPVYVGAPSTGYNMMPNYVDFRNKARAGRIYVGANDGMVHAFDAADGSEVFAYVPSMLFSGLSHFADINYKHKDYLGGELVAADAKIGSSWKTILAGGLGTGAKGLFALDITNPNLSSETANTGADKKILWEKHAASDDDLGHIYGPSSIALLPNDKWYVINGNGYGSVNGDAKLYLVEVGSGVAKRLSTTSSTNNGLSAPVLVDTNFDSKADIAYAGDLKGNLWKFDLSNLSKSGKLLFSAGAGKPITLQPEVAKHPLEGYLVYFGTGSLLSEADALNTDQQSIYAIWDQDKLVSESCGNTQGDLLCQTFSADIDSGSEKVTTISSHAVDWDNHSGWKVDFPHSGERIIGHPQLRDGRLQFVSHNPTGIDNVSWLIELDYLSGGASAKILFDLDGNGSVGNEDKVSGVAPSALYLGEGVFSQPAIARIENGVDTLFINGLLMGGAESKIICSGECTGGIAGGHFDLDVDNVLGGSTEKHTHEYDDKYNVTYGDYFNVLNGGSSVTDVGINASTQKLLAFIANGDLSVGGTIIIGDKSWNVVEYQKMIQKQLAKWDGLTELLDDKGNPLAFTLDQINKAAGGTGTLRLTFDNTAILTGGLIPTQTGCVKSSPSITNGHWRDGALTLHIVDYESVKQNVLNNTPAASRVYSLQAVTDLPVSVKLGSATITLKEDTDLDGVIDTEYGGIIANPSNDSGFLYESTLFWHYHGACYGESNWQQDRDDAVVTQKELDDFLAAQKVLIDQIKSYSCTNYSKGVCKDSAYTSLVDSLKQAISTSFPTVTEVDDFSNSIIELVAGVIDNGDGTKTITTKNVVIKDKVKVIPQTPGPRFRWGRQTWIDL